MMPEMAVDLSKEIVKPLFNPETTPKYEPNYPKVTDVADEPESIAFEEEDTRLICGDIVRQLEENDLPLLMEKSEELQMEKPEDSELPLQTANSPDADTEDSEIGPNLPTQLADSE